MSVRKAHQAVMHLAETVLSLRPLVDVLDRPVRAATADPTGQSWLPPRPHPGRVAAPELLNRVAARVGAPPFDPRPSADCETEGIFTRVVGNRLTAAKYPESVDSATVEWLLEVDHLADEAVARSFEGRCRRVKAVSFDGAAFPVYTAGDRGNPCIVIAAACGMPAKLGDPWIRFLAREHFVITWETRGLFGDLASFNGARCDVAAQAADLFASMDCLRIRQAHLMGMCGGAVIALAAAAQRPERVSSLSLWHGDFELGPECPKTNHQRNLKALMSIAAQGSLPPAGVHQVFCQSILPMAGNQLAHLILYPYATPQLLHRYCQLNGSIMDCCVTPFLQTIEQPVLVVTSEDDETAHPAASSCVAARLSKSTLHIAPHGDHLSLFSEGTDLMRLAARFAARGQL